MRVSKTSTAFGISCTQSLSPETPRYPSNCSASDVDNLLTSTRAISVVLLTLLCNEELKFSTSTYTTTRYMIIYDAPHLVHRVLSCNTLVVLKLTNLIIYDAPHLVHLPSLKALHFNVISFCCDFVHFRNLLCGCPILEHFRINRVALPEICDDPEGEFKGFPSLVGASIFNTNRSFPFAWLHNARFMFTHLSTPYEYRVPTFRNLILMQLMLDSDSRPEKYKWVIQVLLHHCPKLQRLTIDEVSNDELITGGKDWNDPETVLECLSSQLRTCSFRGYKGNECQLQFYEYVLRNSKVLRTMTIGSSCRVDGDEDAKQQKLVKLSSCLRGSVTCKLLFVDDV